MGKQTSQENTNTVEQQGKANLFDDSANMLENEPLRKSRFECWREKASGHVVHDNQKQSGTKNKSQ